MKRPRLQTCVLFGVLGALLALAGAVCLISREVVTVAAFYERLTLGMTEAEVGAAVPLPPGDYTGGYVHTTSQPICEGGLPIYIDYHTRADGTVSAPHPLTGRPIRGKWWRGRDGLVIVFFGDDHRVSERRYYPGKSRSWARDHLARLVPYLDRLVP
jgi:hypothetical protein